MKHRSRTDIVAQILQAAGNGNVTKTRIMYNVFLSYAMAKEYLTVLVENGLLEYDTSTQLYRTTDKGHRFSNVYNQIIECVESGQEIVELPHV